MICVCGGEFLCYVTHVAVRIQLCGVSYLPTFHYFQVPNSGHWTFVVSAFTCLEILVAQIKQSSMRFSSIQYVCQIVVPLHARESLFHLVIHGLIFWLIGDRQNREVKYDLTKIIVIRTFLHSLKLSYLWPSRCGLAVKSTYCSFRAFSWFPRIKVRGLTIACNSSSKGNSLFWPPCTPTFTWALM